MRDFISLSCGVILRVIQRKLFLDQSWFRKSHGRGSRKTSPTTQIFLTRTEHAVLREFLLSTKESTQRAWKPYPRENWVPHLNYWVGLPWRLTLAKQPRNISAILHWPFLYGTYSIYNMSLSAYIPLTGIISQLDLWCAVFFKKIINSLKGLSHGILSYFEHWQNYR